MRRVIQKTITTTKIISLTITHSEEEVEYTLTNSSEQLSAPQPPASEDMTAPTENVIDIPQPEVESADRDTSGPTTLEPTS